jgi:YD repeat-containing protein
MTPICTFILLLAAVLMNNFGIDVTPFKIQDRNNNKMEFYYNVSGQLSAVMDTMGRLINFEYNNYSIEEIRASGEVKPDHGRLSRIIDYSGRFTKIYPVKK